MSAADKKRAHDYLASKELEMLASNLLHTNPWFFNQSGTDFTSIAQRILVNSGRLNASMHLVGSAAVGFSLSPEKAGRPFRRHDNGLGPSDFDVALVDEHLFLAGWEEMVEDDRIRGCPGAEDRRRKNVYWGRIDDKAIPRRSKARNQLLQLSSAIRREPAIERYPISLRLYRRYEDLLEYTKASLRSLAREVK